MLCEQLSHHLRTGRHEVGPQSDRITGTWRKLYVTCTCIPLAFDALLAETFCRISSINRMLMPSKPIQITILKIKTNVKPSSINSKQTNKEQ